MSARTLWLFGAVAFAVLLLNAASAWCADVVVAAESDSAAALVQAALAAEVSASPVARQSLLREAIARNPAYPPARWHAGQVQTSDGWLPLDEAEALAARDPLLAEYRHLRDARAGTPVGELAIARWCRKNKLSEEARYHWFQVLQAQPNSQEALTALGLVWHKGRLVTNKHIQEQRQTAAQRASEEAERRLRRQQTADERKEREKRWAGVVAQWQQAMQRDGAASVRRTIDDTLRTSEVPAAIPLIDAVMRQRSLPEKEQDSYRALSLQWIEVLRDRRSATPLLIENAIWHPSPEVRGAAADALGQRPKDAYVPVLLSQMRSLIEANWVISSLPDGELHWHQTLFQEGWAADQSSRSTLSVPVAYLVNDGTGPWGVAGATMRIRAKMVLTTAATRLRIQQINTVSQEVNERVQKALTRGTGVDTNSYPKTWKQWWNDYFYDHYELQKPEGESLVYEECEYRDIRLLSCFPAGTNVWTMTGALPIQQIKPGDRVLSQSPHTGELSYKTVVSTTTRDPSPLVKIVIGCDSITSTRGHPFWVVGGSWKMAKELEAGMKLHTPSGAVPITSVEHLPAAKAWYDGCHNLIVDDFHTYFVGDQRVLVHDNVLFAFDRVTVPVPGADEADGE